ncbi:MAG: hypothetical protein IIA01_00160 [Proteobacteria bacterium]|nr:hypothetical protein [Pseudomonadota bacterium]
MFKLFFMLNVFRHHSRTPFQLGFSVPYRRNPAKPNTPQQSNLKRQCRCVNGSAALIANAPELNPVAYLWSWLKANPLANFAPHDVEPLAGAARRSARAAQKKQRLLRSFIRHSPLSLRLK